LLHEIGLIVSHTGFHKHGAYLVENADLAGFTNREQQIMSKLVLAQKGNLRKVQEALAEPDMARAVFALRLATLLLHARVEGQLDGLRVRMKSRIEVELPCAWVSQHPTIQVWLEKERGVWEEVGVPMVVRVYG
jgi:exopolyphosphatase/guanosine-5'-triphosphate,3'-diphosphate pyrophosphatase